MYGASFLKEGYTNEHFKVPLQVHVITPELCSIILIKNILKERFTIAQKIEYGFRIWLLFYVALFKKESEREREFTKHPLLIWKI